jgi:ribosomal protein L24
MEIRNFRLPTDTFVNDWVEVMTGSHSGWVGRVIWADRHEDEYLVEHMDGTTETYSRSEFRKMNTVDGSMFL